MLNDPAVTKFTQEANAAFAQDPKVAALRTQQAADDAKLNDGSMSAAQWRAQETERSKQIALLQAGTFPDTTTGDPTLDGYYAIFKNPAIVDQTTGQTIDSQALGDAIDAYRAQLSSADLQRLDNSTGLGTNDTPTVHEYKTAVKDIAASGYFDVGDRVFAKLKESDPLLAGYPSFGAFYDAAAQLVRQKLVEAKQNPDIAPLVLAGLPQISTYNAVVTATRQALERTNPTLTNLLVKWGFKTVAQADLPALAGAGGG